MHNPEYVHLVDRLDHVRSLLLVCTQSLTSAGEIMSDIKVEVANVIMDFVIPTIISVQKEIPR